MRFAIVFVALAVFAGSGGTLALAQTATVAQPPIAGVWRFNPENSTARIPPGATEIRQYVVRPDGFLVGLLITGMPQGPFHTLQFTAKSDGKDYPEYSDQNIADMIANGRATPRTYAERQIDEYTTEWFDKVDGRITGQGRKIVSKDGKTLTITVDGAPQVRVYDRQ
jgi:hypothetical protein